MDESKDARITCKLTEELKKEFKMLCLIKGVTMSDFMEDAIQNFIKENEDELKKVNLD